MVYENCRFCLVKAKRKSLFSIRAKGFHNLYYHRECFKQASGLNAEEFIAKHDVMYVPELMSWSISFNDWLEFIGH